MAMIINKSQGGRLIIIEPPHCGTTSLRAWARDTLRGGTLVEAHQHRHATAREVIREHGMDAWNKATTLAIVRHPQSRALTQCVNIFRAPRPNRMKRLNDFQTIQRSATPDNRQWWPIAEYTHDELRRPLCNIIIRLEEVHTTLRSIADVHQLPEASYPHKNATANKPTLDDTPSYWQKLAAEIYAIDCTLFGYTWHSPHATPGILPEQSTRGKE